MKKLKKPATLARVTAAPTKAPSRPSSASTASPVAPAPGKLPTIVTGKNATFGMFTVIEKEDEGRGTMPGANRFRVEPPSHFDGGQIVTGSGTCLACKGFRQKPSFVKLYVPSGANVGTAVNLCKTHLKDLADAVNYALSGAPLHAYKPRDIPALQTPPSPSHPVRPDETSGRVAGRRAGIQAPKLPAARGAKHAASKRR